MLGEQKPIQRNAIIALAHFNEETAIPELKEVALNDPRPMIRGRHTGRLAKFKVKMHVNL